MNGTTSPSRGRFRSGFLRRDGTALPNASRTMHRCTPSFLATPRIVPTPNSYSRRISSNSSTLALQSTATSAPGCCPQQSSRFFPRWANSKYRHQKARLREKTSTTWIRGLSTGVGEIAFPNPRCPARACHCYMSQLKLIPASPEDQRGLGNQSLAQQSSGNGHCFRSLRQKTGICTHRFCCGGDISFHGSKIGG